MTAPLEGIRIVELGIWVAVPACCSFLADYGADVIKIETPDGGDPARGMMSVSPEKMEGWNYFFELHNRNKRSIGLDLTKPEGRDIAYRLVRDCDVFATNLRYDALQKLGMTYEHLQKIHPTLVYAYCTAYGQRGLERNERGYDHGAFWARSGMMATSGEPGGPPPTQRLAVGDRTVAAMLTSAIMMGLLARDKFGIGQQVHTSLLGCGVFVGAIDVQSALVNNKDISPVSRTKARNPLYHPYKTKDGRWIHLLLVQGERWWPKLCVAIGRPDLIDDKRFNKQEGIVSNNEALISILDEIMAQKTLQEWSKLFEAHELIWTTVSTPLEVARDPQVHDNGYVIDLEHPYAGHIKEVASPIELSAQTTSVRSCAPELGQHTEEVLLELGYSWDDINTFKDIRATT